MFGDGYNKKTTIIKLFIFIIILIISHSNADFFFFFNLSLEQSVHPQDSNESMTHPKRAGIIFKESLHYQESSC